MFIGIAMSVTAGLKGGGFSPATLFTNGEPGVFLDPSDLTTLFQDTAGTIPVTTPGQSVALALDKSKGLVLGSELVTNGDFSSETGWTLQAGWTISGGQLVGNVAASAFTNASVATIPAANRTYQITYTVTSVSSGSVRLLFYGGTVVSGTVRSTAGTFTELMVANAGHTGLGFQGQGAGFVGTIDNISVRELPGNHATQATAGSQPVYARLPANGVRNLANGSADVGNNAVWLTGTTQNGITMTKVASGFDVDGLPYVDVRYQGTSTSTNHDQILPFSFAVQSGSTGQSATCSVIARVISGSVSNVLGFRARMSEETAPSTFIGIALGTPVTASTDTVTTATRTLSTGNQFRATLSLDFNTASAIDVTYRVKAMQVEIGSTRTAYQFNYARTNISQPPFAQVGALLFDGVDDFLQTPSVDFAGYEQLGSELVTNGDFAGGTTGWTPVNATLSVVSGALRVTAVAGGTGAGTYQQISTVAGRTYKLTLTFVADAVTGNSFVYVGTTPLGIEIQFNNIGSTIGTYSFVFTATSSTTFISVNSSSTTLAGETTDWDNISVKEVLRPADKMTVFAGVRKIRDTAQAAVVSVGNLPDTVNGSLSLRAPALALNNYALRSRGTATAPATSGAFLAPDTAVLSGLADISGDAATLRRNGTQISFSNADQGTGNFGNHSIYIGQDGTGAALPFNGYLCSLIVRGAATSADLITSTETWVNSRTGAY